LKILPKHQILAAGVATLGLLACALWEVRTHPTDAPETVCTAPTRTPQDARPAISSARDIGMEQDAYSVESGEIAALLERTQDFETRAVLLESWCDSDLPGALAWFAGLGDADDIYRQARDKLVQTLAECEPADAISWMEQDLPKSARRRLYLPVFQHWGAFDPAGTATLVSEILEAPSHLEIWADVAAQTAAQLAGADVAAAVRWAQSLPEGAARDAALAQAGSAWAAVDPRAAAAFAAGQENPRLARNVAVIWAGTDPRAAAGWTRGLPTGEARDLADAGLAAIWAVKDPQAAANYASSLPEGHDQAVAFQGLFATWAENDAQAAARWLRGLPESPSRTAAAAAFHDAAPGHYRQ